MKKICEVLSHLKNNPEFRKINTSTTIDRLTKALPLKLKKGIKFAYVKKQILYFVLTHPVYKMEFEYNKGLIKSLLKQANMQDIKDFTFFVTNKIEKKEKEKEPIIYYEERSNALFENKAKNQMIFEKFEEIREIIKES